MLGLGTSTMPCRPLFERIDNALIKVSNHQICHNFTQSPYSGDCNDSMH